MFVLGGLLCALLGVVEDAFEWTVKKIRRAPSAPRTEG